MQIRKIDSGEVNIIHELAHRIWPHAFREILSPEQIDYMLHMMYDENVLTRQINEGHKFYIAEDDGAPVGFIGIQLDYPSPGILKIHKIYLLPEQQGKGTGLKLMDKAVEVAQANNIKTVVLNVNRFNNAVEFYKKYGFHIVKEENIDIGNGYWMEDYFMSIGVGTNY